MDVKAKSGSAITVKQPTKNILSPVQALGKSFVYAARGIGFAIKTQRNIRLHLVAALAVCLTGYLLNVSSNDWRWLIACIGLVWLAEMVNTAFEYLCDLIQPEHHLSVQRAKDIAAGAVLMASLTAAIIGILVFWPYILAYTHTP